MTRRGWAREVRALAGSSIAALLVLGASTACTREHADPVATTANVVVILVDTLRSDHLSVGGYRRDTSPSLDEMARRGTYFERHYAHSAVTRPSVASLFSSKYPSGHGVINQGPAALPESIPILPAALSSEGYETFAFVTNPQIHPELGFDRGFDHFRGFFGELEKPDDIKPHDLVKTPARDVFAAVQEALENRGPGAFFAYVHLLDPHGPYTPPADLRDRFVDPDYAGRVVGSVEDFANLQARGERSGPDLAHFQSLYDAEIASTDRAIADFLAWLAAQGLLENTHVIITADHGEGFMEHGYTGHGLELHEETVAVPLLWIGPGVPGGVRVGVPTGVVDVFPTVVDVLDLAVSPDDLRGQSLRPLWEEPGGARPPVFLEGPGKGVASRDGRKIKLMNRGLVAGDRMVLGERCLLDAAECESVQVFDLTRDGAEVQSGEVGPEASERRELIELFEERSARAGMTARATARSEGSLPARIRDRLESLGYLD